MTRSASPFTTALKWSLDGAEDHPSITGADLRSNLSRLALLIAAEALAEFGCAIKRRRSGCSTSALRGFLPPNATPALPGLDHPYVVIDTQDKRPNRVVGLVVEPYRPLDDKFRTALNDWCATTGCIFTDLPLSIHNPSDEEICAVLITKPGLIPDQLELNETDLEMREFTCEQIRKLQRRVEKQMRKGRE